MAGLSAAAWFDYDRDGLLDLFVCHYVQWTPETDVYWSLGGVHKSYTTPGEVPRASRAGCTGTTVGVGLKT